MKNLTIFGIHSVQALLENQPERIQRLCVMQERHDKKLDTIVQLAKKCGITIEHMSRHELDRIAEEGNHQGVIAFCVKSRSYSESDIKPRN